MASSSSSSTFIQTNHHSNSSNLLHISTLVRNGGRQFSLFGGANHLGLPHHLRLRAATTTTKPRKDLVVRINASPNEDAVGDFLAFFSSLSNINIPELLQNPWIPGVAGLLVGSAVPFIIQRLLLLSEKIDDAAEVVERMADRVVEAAEGVEKAAEDWEKSLPEGGLRTVVGYVEDLAEETAKGAQKVSDLMDKVDDMTDTLQDRFEKDLESEPEPESQPRLGTTMGFSQPPARSYSVEPSPSECEICRILKLFNF